MRQRASVANLLSVVFVGLTILTILCYLIILVYPHVFFNPFPPSQQPTPVVHTPTSTPTPGLEPTYTPTNTPTITPTSPPTPTRTPTGTPTVTPTWPPTPTPTARVTRSPFPFTCVATLRRPEYDRWSGVAGHVENLDGEPLPGYYIRTEGAGLNPPAVRAGENTRFNSIYGNEAAWEQAYNSGAYQAIEIRVQLFNDRPNSDGTYRPVSDVVVVQLGGYASGSLGYVVCTLNWENW